MMISTKGRYALRVMVDLAQQDDDGYVSLKSVSERQEISLKYLEMIISALNKEGLVNSQRGKEGGYKLAKPAHEYTVGEILRAAEGDLVPVSCLDCGENLCARSDNCMTLPMWQELDRIINEYLDSVKLTDLINGDVLA